MAKIYITTIFPKIALITAIIAVSFFGYNAFFLFPEQKMVIENLEREFKNHNGSAKIEDIYPLGNWDFVCVIPAHAYGRFTADKETLKIYFGSNYHFGWLTTPDPLSPFYGLGLSFLKNGTFVEFIKIPAAKLSFYREGRFFGLTGIRLKVPEHKIQNKRNDTLHFSDLNVSFLDESQKCYPRKTAYIQFRGYQQIFIGG